MANPTPNSQLTPTSPAPQPPSPSTGGGWWSKYKLWLILGAGGLVLLTGGVLAATLGDDDTSSRSAQSETTATPAKTIDQTGAFKLKAINQSNCQAQVPADWDNIAVNETATAFDAFSPDKTMYAGYGHQTINTSLAGFANAYSPPLNDPDLYSEDPATVALAYTRILIANMGGDSGTTAYTSVYNEAIGEYSLRSVASGTHTGVVFFHSQGFAGDGVNYTYSLPIYFALATNQAWQTNGLSLARVAASINCSAQLVARSTGPDIDSSTGSDPSSEDPNGSEDGYNPQLGTEYVHDPNTGENYVVDPSRDWSNDGPSGGGYYKQNGNDYTQLEPGRSD